MRIGCVLRLWQRQCTGDRDLRADDSDGRRSQHLRSLFRKRGICGVGFRSDRRTGEYSLYRDRTANAFHSRPRRQRHSKCDRSAFGCGSFDNLVTMSATGLPTGATATFNPPTVTPGSAGAPTVMTIQLLVVTPANVPAAPQRRIPFLPFSAAVAMCCAFFFYQRASQGIVRRALLFTSIFLVATLLSACNGGFASKPGTIPGNYVVTVTGTSGSLHPSTTVTITVQ